MWDYLLALNLWAVDREEEAAELLGALGQTPGFARQPDYAPAWVTRALLLEKVHGTSAFSDLRRAVATGPENRIMHIYLIQKLESAGQWEEALRSLDEADGRFPDDFNLALLRAKALINTGHAVDAVEILASTHVLPSENARDSHQLWEQAHTMAALDAYDGGDLQVAREYLITALEWPEHLGQGRPYRPEERLVRFILGRVEAGLGRDVEAREAFEAYLDATGEVASPLNRLDLLTVSALRALYRGAEADALLAKIRTEFPAIERTLEEDLEGRLIIRALSLGLE